MMQSGIVMLYIMTNISISTGLILLAPTVNLRFGQIKINHFTGLPISVVKNAGQLGIQELIRHNLFTILHGCRIADS